MKKKDKKVVNELGIAFTISDKVKSHANDPFVKKKNEEADEFVKKHGLPDFPPRKK
jgi:hypothetical protein